MADLGHNSGDLADGLNKTAQGKLRSFVERWERLNEDKAAVAADIKELGAEIKGEGFDLAIVREVIKLRAQDAAKRQEREALVDLYMSSIGGL